MTSTGHLYGAGVYAETFCVGSAYYNYGTKSGADDSTNAFSATVATLPSNCA